MIYFNISCCKLDVMKEQVVGQIQSGSIIHVLIAAITKNIFFIEIGQPGIHAKDRTAHEQNSTMAWLQVNTLEPVQEPTSSNFGSEFDSAIL